VKPGFNQATIDFNPISRILTLTVAKSEIEKNQPDKLEYIESRKMVSFEEDWKAPEDIQEALGGDLPVTIKVGDYPVIFNNGYYSFFFQV
jgi:hypothetical protein